MLRMLPVVEFHTGIFRTQDHKVPDVSGSDDLSGWYQYWKRCLADAGIVDLEPYQHSEFVCLQDIHDIALRQLLAAHIAIDEDEDLSIIEQISPLSGGYVLEFGAGARILPQCCGSLANLVDWEDACTTVSADAEVLWIGHPWLTVRSMNAEQIHICETQEYELPKKPLELLIQRSDLSEIIADLKPALEFFRKRLVSAIPSEHEAQAEQIADVLVYDHPMQ